MNCFVCGKNNASCKAIVRWKRTFNLLGELFLPAEWHWYCRKCFEEIERGN